MKHGHLKRIIEYLLLYAWFGVNNSCNKDIVKVRDVRLIYCEMDWNLVAQYHSPEKVRTSIRLFIGRIFLQLEYESFSWNIGKSNYKVRQETELSHDKQKF